MGILDRFFSKKDDNTSYQQVDDTNEKRKLASQIVNLVNSIEKINSFDSSIWNLSNCSTYDLERKSLSQLQQIHSELTYKLEMLKEERQKGSSSRKSIEESKWTGKKSNDMSDKDLDRAQKSDDYR